MFNNKCNDDRPNLYPPNCYIVGPTGPTGPTPTLTIGTVTTGEPGSQASVTITPANL